MNALQAFPRHLTSEISRASINLKYPCKSIDGTLAWAGLRAAKDSPDNWINLMSDCGRISEIGVCVDDCYLVESPSREPITVESGVPLNVWLIPGDSIYWVNLTDRNNPFRAPPTHEVCYPTQRTKLRSTYPILTGMSCSCHASYGTPGVTNSSDCTRRRSEAANRAQSV